MRTVLLDSYLLSQADIDAGKANSLPAGSPIFVIDGNSVPTGKEYRSTGSSTPTEAVTGNNINTVLSAAGGAGWAKIQATTPNYVITRPVSGAGLDLHIEAGSLAAITAVSWPIPATGVDQLRIRNFSGQAQNFTAGSGWTIVTADGNPVTSGSYSIPDDRAVEITLDPNGFAQVVPWGGEVSAATFNTHTANISNPHSVTKSQVQLGNADNVSDANKPVSTAQQTVFDTKEAKVTGKGLSTNDYTTTEKNKLAGVAAGATANDTDANLKARANHTGTQSADTVIDGTTNKAYTATEKTKLSGVATGATANDTDVNLKARANHTGTQAQSTIDNLTTDLGNKAPLSSPTFTNVPAAPTPAVDTNTTQIATTAFVNAQLSGTLPVMDGTATVGSGNRSARGNHVHPKDTAKQDALVSGNTVKTLNNQSLLGSGDIVITPTTVSSTVPTHNLDLVSDNYAGRALHLRPNGMTATANLATWSDSSGNGNDAVQATAAKQPDVVESVLNGKPVVRFDGVDDLMTFSRTIGAGGMIFAVATPSASANAYMISGNGAGDKPAILANYGFGTWEWFAGNNRNDIAPAGTTGVHLIAVAWQDGGTVRGYLDGAETFAVAQSGNLNGMAFDSIGATNVNAGYFGGDIAETIVFNSVLALAERQKVEGYLAAKFGLQANLDAGHPYKTNPPQVGDLQTLADNNAAITAGLLVGAVYMSADGLLRVRF